MKNVFKSIFLFCVLSFIIFGCNSNQEEEISYTEINQADSLRLTEILFDSMYAEIYSDPLYQLKRKDVVHTDFVCEPRGEAILKIRVNKLGEYMIGIELNGDITNRVYEFYTTNQEKNDPTNSFPMYSRISMDELEDQIRAAKQDLKDVENTQGVSQDIIEFKKKRVEEWENKKKVLATIGGKELAEIHFQAHIELEYPQNFKKKNELLDSILLAFYQMRDKSSLKYFNRSYLSLFYEYSETKRSDIWDKLDALKVLHPIVLIDIPYCKENDVWLWNYSIPPPPPPFVE